MAGRDDVSILIFDDSPTMLGIVEDMLMRLGYLDIEQADSGPSALDKRLRTRDEHSRVVMHCVKHSRQLRTFFG